MIYRFGDVTIDEERDEIRRAGEVVPAQKKVRDLLLYLIRRRERLVPKEELFAALWPGVVVNEAALSQAIYGARRAVGDDAREGHVLRTVRGRGVRFVAPVEEREARVEAVPAAVWAPAVGTPPFVGREDLLDDLGGALRAASGGDGGVFLMAGEPGIGKTRAAEEFAAVAREHGASVHLGRCHEAPGAPAFWPWVQAVRSLASECEGEDLASLLDSDAADLAPIVPELVPGGRGRGPRRETVLDPGPARFRLFDAVTRLWKQAADARPVVLILDDLHRADPPSWRLLHFLARELRDTRILVAGTYRDVDAHRDAEVADLLAELARQPGVRSVQLRGLESDAVRTLLRSATSRDPDPAVVDALLERTNGNPFFLTHLASLMVQAGAEQPDAPLDPSRIALPRTLREAVARQLDGLPEGSRHVLQTAAVIGRAFALNVLEATANGSRDKIIDALDACAKAGLVQSESGKIGHFRFAHIMVRDALYDGLSITGRAQTHEKVGRVLEKIHRDDLEPHLDELAHHFSAASIISTPTRARKYAERAGAFARSRLAFEEAAKYYARALDLLDAESEPDEEDRCQLLLDLGEALTRAGQREEARANFAKAASLASRLQASEKLAEVALAAAPGFFSIESAIYDSFTVSLLESALAFLPQNVHRLRAQTLARLAMALYWADAEDRRTNLVRAAADAADQAQDYSASAYALAARYAALWTPDTLEDRVRLGPQLRSLADASDDLSMKFVARVFEITTLLEQGDFPQYYSSVDEFTRLATFSGDLHAGWYARLFNANVALMRGHVEDSMRLAREFRDLGAGVGDRNAMQSFVGYLVTTKAIRGDFTGLAEHARDQALRYPAMVCWRSTEALMLALDGKSEQADLVVESLLWPDLKPIRNDMNRILSLGLLALAVAVRGSREGAEVVLEALRPYSDRHLVAGYGSLYWGSAARPLSALCGILGRKREAGEFREQAAEREKRGGVSMAWADAIAQGGLSAPQ